MRVVKSEVVGRADIGRCENCGRSGVRVRSVQAVGWLRESRGFYRVCFDCFGPCVWWQKGAGGTTYESPVR